VPLPTTLTLIQTSTHQALLPLSVVRSGAKNSFKDLKRLYWFLLKKIEQMSFWQCLLTLHNSVLIDMLVPNSVLNNLLLLKCDRLCSQINDDDDDDDLLSN